MPDAPHESLHHPFREDPTLATRALLEVCGVDLRIEKVTELNVDMTELSPLERRIDTVLKLEPADRPPFVMGVESQTRPDERKRESWPQHITHLRAKYRTEVGLLVITQHRATAVWARAVITSGIPGLPPNLIFKPTVMGPDNVKMITDPAQARLHPAYTALTTYIHAFSPGIDEALRVLMDSLGTIDTETAITIAEYTEAGLQKAPALSLWKALLSTSTHPFKSSLRLEAEAAGEAKALLIVLKGRKICVTDEIRDRILACTDSAVLETWLERAGHVTKIEQLFA
ncbi:hypothetical protein GCM10027589_05740 [Actinocorallia lasiicapitis]